MDDLVIDLLQMLLAGDNPGLEILRTQLNLSKRKPPRMSGVGFFVDIDVPPDAPRIPGNLSFAFGDVIGEIEGVQHGAGFVLFIRNGVLSMLEGYTYDEPWPEKLAGYHLKYAGGENRNLDALTECGWPIELL